MHYCGLCPDATKGGRAIPTIWLIVLALSWLITILTLLGAYRLFLRNGKLLLQIGELHRRFQPGPLPVSPGLPPGCVVHDFELPDLQGNRVRLSGLRGRRLLLIYVDPRCAFSHAMLPDLATLSPDPPAGMPKPIVVTTGDLIENRRLFERHGITCTVLVQEDMELADLHAVAYTPMAYLVDEQEMTVGSPASGAIAIMRLARGETISGEGPGFWSRGNHATRRIVRVRGESLVTYDGLPPGTRAPEFRLPTPTGETLSLDEVRGRRVLLVFSDPACLPCRQLVPQLERIHRQAPETAMMIVSRGTVAANRAMVAELELTIPMALQRYWDTSRNYRTMATPAASLIDERGYIASDPALGSEAVLALAAHLVREKEAVPMV